MSKIVLSHMLGFCVFRLILGRFSVSPLPFIISIVTFKDPLCFLYHFCLFSTVVCLPWPFSSFICGRYHCKKPQIYLVHTRFHIAFSLLFGMILNSKSIFYAIHFSNMLWIFILYILILIVQSVCVVCTICIYVTARGLFQLSSSILQFIFFRLEVSLNLELVVLARRDGQKKPGILLILAPSQPICWC